MNMKLFISDYDGTYLRPMLKRSDQLLKNAEAVNRWQVEDGLFGFSTGRILPLIEAELEEQPVKVDFMIVANGALVLDGKRDVIAHQVLAPELTEEVITFLTQSRSFNFICSNGWNGYHSPGVVTASSMAETFLALKEAGYFHLTLEESLSQGISQFSIVDLTVDEVEQLTGELRMLFQDRLTIYPNRSSIDLSPRGVSKATGIQQLLDYLELSPSQVICMGDSWNDVEMIQQYQGLTVPEAPMILKEAAIEWFPTVEEALNWAIQQKRLPK